MPASNKHWVVKSLKLINARAFNTANTVHVRARVYVELNHLMEAKSIFYLQQTKFFTVMAEC